MLCYKNFRMSNNKSDIELHQLAISNDSDEASFNKFAKTFFRENTDSKFTQVKKISRYLYKNLNY